MASYSGTLSSEDSKTSMLMSLNWLIEGRKRRNRTTVGRRAEGIGNFDSASFGY